MGVSGSWSQSYGVRRGILCRLDANHRPYRYTSRFSILRIGSHGGLEVNEARRLRALEEENRRLKRLVAEQALDVLALRDLLSKNY